MNWKLFAFMLIVFMVGAASGGFVSHKATLETNKANLAQMQPTLDKAIEKATNEITNEIKIDKIKKSDSIKIILSPNNKQKTTVVPVVRACGPDSICVAIKHLTRRQEKRLGLR